MRARENSGGKIERNSKKEERKRNWGGHRKEKEDKKGKERGIG